MDVNRATEILESPQKITVQHQGRPVWIESIDPVNKTAAVHPEDAPGESSRVEIAQLQELQ